MHRSYASDITCSYPVKGTFTKDQRDIYESVLDAQLSVIRQLRPGVSWLEMHRESERAILRGLIKCGVLNTNGRDDLTQVVEEMLEVDLGAVFMPHGLGHLIGLDTHDVGGYSPGTPHRSPRPGVKKLRTARIMEEGVAITVEPGCYFIDPLLDMALADDRQKKFLNRKRLADFRGFGGIRLEDNVVVTADGCINLTLCPRAVQEVLDVMSGGQWPPKEDVLPGMQRNWVACRGGKIEKLDIKSV